MSITRRSVIVQGGVIAAGVVASNMSGMQAWAQAPKTPVRRSLQGLAWNDPIVATYREGVRILQALPATEKFNWVKLSEIHGSPAGFKYCPHGDWYFLPWHRAFTAMYEQIIRKVTLNKDFALPYWDWTASPTLPEVFVTPTTPDGKPNSLYVASRTWPANKPMPASIVGPKVLETILAATPYEVFGTSQNPRQNSTDPSWVPAGGGVQGTLEATPHNLVHNNIGGFMPTPSSPRDPIFFMHHGNIDRIWATWNLRHANTKNKLWTDMRFTNNFYKVDGTFWSPLVSDLYSPEALGYSYGLSKAGSLVAAGPRTLSLTKKLTSVMAAPAAPAAAAGVTIAAMKNERMGTASEPLTLPVEVPAAAMAKITSQPIAPSGTWATDFVAAQERAASIPRVYAFLRDVEITNPSTTSIRVYLGAPEDPKSESPETDPHYVGSFAVLDHNVGHAAHADHGASNPSFMVDLTDAIQRLKAETTDGKPALDLQLYPVGAGTGEAGSVKPAELEITVVSA